MSISDLGKSFPECTQQSDVTLLVYAVGSGAVSPNPRVGRRCQELCTKFLSEE